jgi:hypothetical protein
MRREVASVMLELIARMETVKVRKCRNDFLLIDFASKYLLRTFCMQLLKAL